MAEEMVPQASPPSKKKPLLIGISTALVLALAVVVYWLFWLRFEESTEDAYVGGNQVVLNAQVSGNVTAFYADNTNFVHQKQLLATIAPQDATLDLERTKAELATTLRTVLGMFQRVEELEADLKKAKAELIKTLQDFEHRNVLVESGGVSKEDFEHAQAALLFSQGDVEAIFHQWITAQAAVENTTVRSHPLVQTAIQNVKMAWLKLVRCKILSPATGIVARRNIQVGKRIDPETFLLAIVPLDQMWIDANFKEVQLKNIRIGQPVQMTADQYGRDMIYHGKIIGIAGGTGSVFSLLPPQNATGNWIKIVQRLPVRISLDPDELKRYPLRLGLSMKVTIDTKDRGGSVIPPLIPACPQACTSVYDDQLEGVGLAIESIIKENTDLDCLIKNPAEWLNPF